MNIIKSEDLSINELVTIKEKRIGNNNSKLIIAENFFNNPHFVREYALECSYIDEKVDYNLGTKGDETHWYTHRIGMNEIHYREFFDWARKTLFEDNAIHYTVFPYQFSFHYFDKMGTNTPHVDNTRYAGLVSLNTNEELSGKSSGTGFYRYKKTKQETITSQTYNNWSISKEGPNAYEKYYMHYHKFNTLILYEGNLLHNGEANYDVWNEDVKRLTFNCFTW